MNTTNGRSEKIQIYWNGKSEFVRRGSKVESLLTTRERLQVLQGEAVILDEHGFEIGLGGSMYEGEKLNFRKWGKTEG